MKKYLVVLLIVLLTFVLSACAEQQPVMTEVAPETTAALTTQTESAPQIIEVVDAVGTKLKFNHPPERTVCLVDSYADLWVEAGGDLVGVVESERLNDKIKDKPTVGDVASLNVEAILALKPDLIIISAYDENHLAIMPVMAENNIAVYQCNYNRLEATAKTFKNFTRILDKEDLYVNKMQPILDKVNALQDNKREFSYLLLLSTAENVAVNEDTIATEIIDNLGGKNIAKHLQITDEETKKISFEKVLEADPDYIFVQTVGDSDKVKKHLKKNIFSHPAWSGLSAVKNDKSFYLPAELFLYKPNIRYADSYQYITDILEGKIELE